MVVVCTLLKRPSLSAFFALLIIHISDCNKKENALEKKIFAKRTALLRHICLTFLPSEFKVKSDLGCMYVEETAANVGLIEIWIYAVVKKNHTM